MPEMTRQTRVGVGMRVRECVRVHLFTRLCACVRVFAWRGGADHSALTNTPTRMGKRTISSAMHWTGALFIPQLCSQVISILRPAKHYHMFPESRSMLHSTGSPFWFGNLKMTSFTLTTLLGLIILCTQLREHQRT